MSACPFVAAVAAGNLEEARRMAGDKFADADPAVLKLMFAWADELATVGTVTFSTGATVTRAELAGELHHGPTP